MSDHDNFVRAPRVWLLILNWNNGRDTTECLNSILECRSEGIAGVVVCDNASTDDSVDRIKAWAAALCSQANEFSCFEGSFVSSRENEQESLIEGVPVFLLHTGGNLGFAGGNNVGLEFIRRRGDYDFVLLLNNDAVLTQGALTAMTARMSEQGMGMCGCTVVYHHTPDRVQAYGGARFNRWLGRAQHIGAGAVVSAPRDRLAVERELDYVLGAALMISRPCLETIGLMDEGYFLYYEEIDWATRAGAHGFRLAYADDAVVFHKEGGTIGSSASKSRRSLLSEYYLVRSRIRFTRKFHFWRLPSVVIFTLLQISRPALRGDFKRTLTGLRALFGLPLLRAGR